MKTLYNVERLIGKSYSNDDFLTSEEACKRVYVSSRTLERYVRNGFLKKYRRRIGREVYYKRSEVEDLLRIRPAEDIEDQRRYVTDLPSKIHADNVKRYFYGYRSFI